MNYISVCSGIEAATVAWNKLGWNPLGFSEIDKFPSAVLQHHYPNVPNLGDMTKYKEWNINESVDLIIGGTPCQSFSVAGLRGGLEDSRGNLTLTFVQILNHFKPKWFIWENVPGVFSSNNGRDFHSFTQGIQAIGYGIGWRVLDAQYFGLAQRRKRVFVVGNNTGNLSSIADVLFERESLFRNLEESRQKRKSPTKKTGKRSTTDDKWPSKISNTLEARYFKDGGIDNQHINANCPKFIPVTVYENHGTDSRVKPLGEVSTTVTARWGTGGNNTPLVKEPILGGQHPNAAIGEEVAPTLTNAMGSGGGHIPLVAPKSVIRKLTPVECERLQGFPDNYTQIPWRGKENKDCPNGPRYKALGNSMAVPVIQWLGERIKGIDARSKVRYVGNVNAARQKFVTTKEN
tara:strand:- start:12550 stop:13761 length:1212 start_codon:yes stop_codon:yes gene_type:complete